ncbi:MAG TPA: aldehyde dehydrogenase family protein, partial [Cyclobacteriaceae bacterium]
MEKILNYINGELLPAQSENWLDNFNPSIGKVYSLIPDSNSNDIDKAVDAAAKAFPSWSSLPVAERSNILLKIANGIDKQFDVLAKAESEDNGKPLKLAQSVDIPRASANIRFFATAILHFESQAHQTDQEAVNYTTRTPLGVV